MGLEPAANGKGMVVIMKQRAGHLVQLDLHQLEYLGPLQQHPADDPQEQVPPGPVRGCHRQSQRHPAQPGARVTEEEAGSPHQELLSTYPRKQ